MTEKARSFSWEGIAFFLAALVVSLALQFRTTNLSDIDLMYHLGHAQVYAQHGPFYEEFPWASVSIISVLKADLWWGFHVVLIPMTWIPPGLMQLKLTTSFIMLAALVQFYYAFRVLGVRWPWLWPFALLALSDTTIWRMSMGRPQVLSMGAFALMAAFLLKDKPRGAFWAAFAIGFLHQTISWLVLPVAIWFGVMKNLGRQENCYRSTALALLGAGLPWILRPSVVGNLELMRIQIVEVGAARKAGLPLDFGTELFKMSLSTFSYRFAIPLAIALVLVGLACWRLRQSPNRENGVQLIALGIPTAVLAVGVVTTSSRISDQLSTFLVLLLAVSASGAYLLVERHRAHLWIRWAGLALVVGLGARSVIGSATNMNRSGMNPLRLQQAATWLKMNSGPGEVVFHPFWPMFGELFYWNQRNRYLGGMDPIFQYTYDSGLYWKAYHLSAWRGGKTTSRFPDSSREREDSVLVMTRDFDAGYYVQSVAMNEKQVANLSKDPRAERVFDRDGVVIYRFLSESERNLAGQKAQ